MANYSELSYADLQALAQEREIPYHKISKEDLVTSLEAYDVDNPDGATPKDADVPPADDTKEVKEPVNKDNTAFVYDKADHLTRTFDVEIHGENFAALAKQFAEKFQYTVKVAYVAPAQICKNCGARMDE